MRSWTSSQAEMRDVYGRGKYATLQHRHFVTSRAAVWFPT
jgi:hypothetical protein